MSTNVANAAAASGLRRGRNPYPRGLPWPRNNFGGSEAAREGAATRSGLRRGPLIGGPNRPLVRLRPGTSGHGGDAVRRPEEDPVQSSNSLGLPARPREAGGFSRRSQTTERTVRQASYINPVVPLERKGWVGGVNVSQRRLTDGRLKDRSQHESAAQASFGCAEGVWQEVRNRYSWTLPRAPGDS